MPRGYWRIIIAAVGWLILAATPVPNSSTRAEQDNAATKVERSLEAIAGAQNKIAEATDPGEYDLRCGDSEYNNNSDLCAQWYAARAARDAADWAYWALIVGLIGSAGIIVALLLTIDSNRIARDTAKRQLRAYISIEPGGVNKAIDGRHRVPLNIINTGQTPARDLELFGDFLIVTGSPLEFNPETHGRFSGQLASTDQSLGGQTNRWTFAYMESEMAKPFLDEIAKRTMAIVHYGFIQYKDVFGNTWRTGFAFYHWGEELSDLDSKRCRFGNYST